MLYFTACHTSRLATRKFWKKHHNKRGQLLKPMHKSIVHKCGFKAKLQCVHGVNQKLQCALGKELGHDFDTRVWSTVRSIRLQGVQLTQYMMIICYRMCIKWQFQVSYFTTHVHFGLRNNILVHLLIFILYNIIWQFSMEVQ